MKTLFKYLLCVYMFLLSGFSPLFAWQYKENAACASLATLAEARVANIVPVKPQKELSIKPALVGTANYELNIPFYENEEDDDLISFKKLLKHYSYFVYTFAQPTVFISGHSKGLTFSYNDFSHISAPGYITLRVFRI